MERIEGVVLDIFIPKEYENGKLVDIYDRNKITIKVETEYSVENIELIQDYENTKLHIGDKVIVTKQTIDDEVFTDVEKME